MSREAIMQALFALVSASPSFVTKSRRVLLWTDVPISAKPAIFMAEKDDTYSGAERLTPPKVEMNVELYVYTAPGMDSGVTPIAVMNPLLDAIDLALRPGPNAGGRQTLGGLVSHCYINGKVVKEPGDLDGDGIALIPIKILATY